MKAEPIWRDYLAESHLRLQMQAQITAGLLASGHYTQRDNDGDPEVTHDSSSFRALAVIHAQLVVEDLVGTEAAKVKAAVRDFNAA